MNSLYIGSKRFWYPHLIGASDEGEEERLARRPGVVANQLFELLVRRLERCRLPGRARRAREAFTRNRRALGLKIERSERVWVFYAPNVEHYSLEWSGVLIRVSLEQGSVRSEWGSDKSPCPHARWGECERGSVIFSWEEAKLDFDASPDACRRFLFKDLDMSDDRLISRFELFKPCPSSDAAPESKLRDDVDDD